MDRVHAEEILSRVRDRNDPIDAAVIIGEMYVQNPELYAALHGREIAPGVHIQNPGPDANKMAEKLLRRAGEAGGDYVDGMQNPRRDPVQAAVNAEGKYENRVKEAMANKSYGKGVRAQDYAEAVRIATEDGGNAYMAGVAKRASKILRVFQDLAPRMGALSQEIQRMPQDTEAQREARLLAAMRGMKQIGRARKGAGGR